MGSNLQWVKGLGDRLRGWVTSLSRVANNCLFDGPSESLCSRAWRLRGQSKFWMCWVRVFGRIHCAKSFREYHGDQEER